MDKKEKMIPASVAIDAIKSMYDAAVCAVCQCDDNAEGMFPCSCDCDQTEKRDKILSMLRRERKENLTKILDL